MPVRWHSVGFALLLGAAGCASVPVHAAAPTPRSPSLDYPVPSVQTSDGYAVGADRIPTYDKLPQGPSAGVRGTTPILVPSDGPATAEPKPKPQQPAEPPKPGQSVQTPAPPCAQIGLQNAAGQPACKGQ